MNKALGLATLMLSSMLAGCAHQQTVYAPPPPMLDYQAIQQQGEHDGFEGARHDVEANRPPSFDHHPRYRNPPVPSPAIPTYRKGFRRGYEQFLHQPSTR